MTYTIFDLAKKNYQRRLWTNEMLQKLMIKGKLTANEYETIINSTYNK